MHSRGRIFLAGLVAAVVLVAAPAVALAEWPAHWTTQVTILAGADRYETAVEISEEAYPGSPAGDGRVVVTGRNWPDALGGSALAGVLDWPIVPVDYDPEPPVVAAEMNRSVMGEYVILGGTAVVSDKTYDYLVDMGTSMERIAGVDRYETSRKMAQRVIAEQGVAYDGVALVATGANFPDALAASPLAAANGWPIYLADPGGDPLELANAMFDDGVREVVVLGGYGAVAVDMNAAVNTVFGIGNLSRLSGADRYETAVAIATYGTGGGLDWDGLAIATGENFPDALSGGVLCAKKGSVMLLVPSSVLPESVAQALSDHTAEINDIYFLGGEAAVSEAMRDAVGAVLH